MNRGWKILAACVGVAALGAAALAVWIKSVESRRWAEMERTLRGLVQEAASRPSDRPPLRGEPLPGNAWDDYDRALRLMKENGSVSPLTYPPPVDPTVVRDILKRQALAIAAARPGVRRAEGARKVDWEKPEGRNNLSAQYLPQLLASQGLQEARAADSAELLLDALRIATDVGTNAEMISGLVSNGSETYVLDRLEGVVLRGAMSPQELREVARQLDLLDHTHPKFGDILVNGAMCAGLDMRLADSVGDYLKFYQPLYPQGLPRAPTWRFAFSDRLMLKDAFERELTWSRRIALADARSWADVSRIARQVDAERAACNNPIPQIAARWLSADGYYSLSASFRERRAQMRLLRAAALFRAGGGVPDVDDPFDGKLYRQEAEGRLKIWSVGRNGVSDGGSGAWNPNEGKDIVLEVTR